MVEVAKKVDGSKQPRAVCLGASYALPSSPTSCTLFEKRTLKNALQLFAKVVISRRVLQASGHRISCYEEVR